MGKNTTITDVHEGSFMDKNGFKIGNEIVEWEGKKHIHRGTLGYRMKMVRLGLDIHIVIRRGEQLISKIVKAPPYPKDGHYRFPLVSG